MQPRSEGNESHEIHRTKVVRAEIKVLDAAAGRVQAIVSTEVKDRDGDVMRQAGWKLKSFLAHPVLLSSHDYRNLRSQIGEWESMKVRGGQMVGVARYYIGEGNAEADWGFKLAQRGMAAYSVGFIPDMSKAVELSGDGVWPNYEFRSQELLEVSQVTIPANPEALQAVRTLGLHPAIAEIVDEMAGGVPEGVPDDELAASVADHIWPRVWGRLDLRLEEMYYKLLAEIDAERSEPAADAADEGSVPLEATRPGQNDLDSIQQGIREAFNRGR